MKAVKTGGFHRQAQDSEFSKKGSLKFHYVLEGTEEELATYKEAQGTAYYRTFEDTTNTANPLNGKPMWFTGQRLADTVEVKFNKDSRVVPVESLEDAMAREDAKRAIDAADKALEKKAQMAAKYGLTVTF